MSTQQSWVPEYYIKPEAHKGRYLNLSKLAFGDLQIRILSTPILGWLDWTEDKKPVRFRYHEKPENSLVKGNEISEFWAFIVWNYSEEKLQVMEVTQKRVIAGIVALQEDPNWGSPLNYDIKIIKEKVNTTRFNTGGASYSARAMPPKLLAPHILEELAANPINLEALYSSGNPFDASSYVGVTPKVEEKEIDLNQFVQMLPPSCDSVKAVQFIEHNTKILGMQTSKYLARVVKNLPIFLAQVQDWDQTKNPAKKAG